MLDRFFSGPDYFPSRINFENRTVDFLRLSLEDYISSSFLDQRIKCSDPKTYTVSLSDLLEYWARNPKSQKPVHFIFHTAFSCSTLLARSLEIIPNCFVLKEPLCLTQLVHLRFDPRFPDDLRLMWPDILDLLMGLLCRTYNTDDVIVIKTHPYCTAIGESLLERDSRSRALFLFTDLRTFLLLALKRPTYVRRSPLVGPPPRAPGLSGVNSNDLSDAECAAYLWLDSIFRCGSLLQRYGASRMNPVNADTLLEYRQETLKTSCNTFDLTCSERDISRILKGPIWNYHAKEPEKRFDMEDRTKELILLEHHYGREADEGVAWIELMLKRYKYPSVDFHPIKGPVRNLEPHWDN